MTLRTDVETLQINALSIPFDGRKMAVKTMSEVHRYGNELQICLLHFSTDCAGKIPLSLSICDKAHPKKSKKDNNKTVERVWEHPKVFAIVK